MIERLLEVDFLRFKGDLRVVFPQISLADFELPNEVEFRQFRGMRFESWGDIPSSLLWSNYDMLLFLDRDPLLRLLPAFLNHIVTAFLEKESWEFPLSQLRSALHNNLNLREIMSREQSLLLSKILVAFAAVQQYYDEEVDTSLVLVAWYFGTSEDGAREGGGDDEGKRWA